MIVHVADGWEESNGAANIARLLASEQSARGERVVFRRWTSPWELAAADEVWIHCGWKPCLWWAALWARRAVWVPEACYDPVRLAWHGWKKRLVGPVERWALRRMTRLVATCTEECAWIRVYLGSRCPPVDVTDIRRFFSRQPPRTAHQPLRVLYFGRPHPLKGVEFLEAAIRCLAEKGCAVDYRRVNGVFGEAREDAFVWCDVLVLPTLSDNFGLVVAEALARGCRVVTTDGAPAWADDRDVVYLRGYRSGSDVDRIRLLAEALSAIGADGNVSVT